MKTFISYRHTGESLDYLKALLTPPLEALRAKDIDAYCTLERQDEYTSQSWAAHQIMEQAFRVLDECDFLFVIQASAQKSEGMLMEVGYCIAKRIPVVVATKQGIGGTYLPAMASHSLIWETPEDLAQKVATFNFSALLQG